MLKNNEHHLKSVRMGKVDEMTSCSSAQFNSAQKPVSLGQVSPNAKDPNNDLSAVCKRNSLSILIGYNNVS